MVMIIGNRVINADIEPASAIGHFLLSQAYIPPIMANIAYIIIGQNGIINQINTKKDKPPIMVKVPAAIGIHFLFIYTSHSWLVV